MTSNIQLPENLEDFCTFPQKPLDILKNYLSEQNIIKTQEELVQELVEDWACARQNDFYRYEGATLIFPIRYLGRKNKSIEISLRRSSCKEGFLFLYYVNLDVADKTLAPLQHFENFAFLGTWATYLEELAAIAAPELWEFTSGRHDKPKDILAQYIKSTFYRLECENKIMVSDDGTLAVFNTGLVDAWSNDIYAFFIPNSGITKWKAAGFSTAAVGSRGKQLLCQFKDLPQRASYFKDIADTVLDASKRILVDWKHIIIDNIERLPMGYLKQVFIDSDVITSLLNQYEESNFRNPEILAELKNEVAQSTSHFIYIQSQLQSAIDYSLRLVTNDYRIAVPSYYPRGNKMALLLPLYLRDKEAPDAALVVECLETGRYQGHTILTLEQAYIDARVVGPLAGTWLGKIDFLK